MYEKSSKRNGAYALLVNEARTVEPERCKWISCVMKFWMVTLILGGSIYVIDYFELRSMSLRLANLHGTREPIKLSNSLKGYLINTPGCRIPDMDPFDPSVIKYIEVPSIKKCNKGISPLFQSNFTSIYMVPSTLPQYGLKDITQLNCCYQPFIRQNPEGDSDDNQVIYDEKCTTIDGEVALIDSEFIKIVCRNLSSQKIYEDYFPFVPARKINMKSDTKMRPNILVLGLDGVSRLNLHRQLPKAHKFLTETIGAIELLGYNKVADNTFPNLIPVLTGMFENELQKACWPNSAARFDSCPFIWKNFSNNGYVTAMGEDCSSIGLFNYQKVGFREQPTNYYITGFQWEMESNIGTDHDFNCKQCVGGRKSYTVQLDYIRKFVRRMQLESTPYFGFFWGNSLSHDYLNRPASGDETYHELFRYLWDNGHLNDTILIFMSDHGIRWGDIRKTYQGQMEERLPFVLIALPDWFKREYSTAVANLQQNVRRLTTPFDLHETLQELKNVTELSVRDNTLSTQTGLRGYSLFSQIPKNRTCSDAQIVSHWCTCQQSIEVKTNDSEVVSAAEFAVYHMNHLLEGYAECATLALDDILGARLLSHDNKHMDGKHSMKDYTITLKTVPGDGVFEVTVRIKDEEALTSSAYENKWRNFYITGTISRLNLYGRQSYCITDFHLKLYCYCDSLLN